MILYTYNLIKNIILIIHLAQKRCKSLNSGPEQRENGPREVAMQLLICNECLHI